MNQDSAAFLRAVKGPVMMITIGTLFALDNFTPFKFHQTWPVLLVVAGILSLGKGGASYRGRARYQAQWGPPRPPGPQPPPPPAPASGPSWAPTGPPTAPPGTYRGSSYEATPGGSGPRGSENKENREKPSRPEPSAAGGSPQPGSGGAQ
jgi:hypothetical protein